MKKLRITVDGKSYDVVVEVLDNAPVAAPSSAPLAATTPPVAVAAPRPAAAAPAPVGDGAIVSPLAGKVISVDVKIGDTIAAGAQVATIEAMKMNTFIYAEQAGKVTNVLVAAGDAVEEGAALLQLG